MKIRELLEILDKKVPFNSAESWDNVGLLIGDSSNEVNGILTALDCTYDVVEEAIDLKYNTIVAHHPLIFKGVKSIINDDSYGSIIYKLIQNNINLIALHTNLDVHPNGVNAMLAHQIGLENLKVLNPQKEQFYKVQVFIPKENADTFKDALDQNGFAKESNYEYCFFNSDGTGQFKPVDNANPTLGQLNVIENVQEVKIEFMIGKSQFDKVIEIIHQYHPYEVPVFDMIPMDRLSDTGLGMIGELSESRSIETFVKHVKSALNIPSVKFTGDIHSRVKKIAIIGGAGIGFEYSAQKQGADLFITGDIKHHEALDAKTNGMNLLDINHYSEYVAKDGLVSLISEWTDYDNIRASQINTDPFKYM